MSDNNSNPIKVGTSIRTEVYLAGFIEAPQNYVVDPAFYTERNKQQELTVFHPLVENWLNENGYDFIHHKYTPSKSVVDYYAVNLLTREALVIECKCSKLQIGKAIRQVMGYTYELNQSEGIVHIPCIAIPSQFVDDKAMQKSQKAGIRIISIDGFQESENYAPSPNTTITTGLEICTAMFEAMLLERPHLVIERIVLFHERQETSPIRDLIDLWFLYTESAKRRSLIWGYKMPTDLELKSIHKMFVDVLHSKCKNEEERIYIDIELPMRDVPSYFGRRVYVTSDKTR